MSTNFAERMANLKKKVNDRDADETTEAKASKASLFEAEVETPEGEGVKMFSEITGLDPSPIGEDFPLQTYFHKHDEWKAEHPWIAQYLTAPLSGYVNILELMYPFARMASQGQVGVITGDPSTGKTTMVMQMAALLGKPVMLQSCKESLEEEDFLYKTVLDEKGTHLKLGNFIKLLDFPSQIIMDEVFRLRASMAMNFQNLNNGRHGFFTLPDDSIIRKHSECWWVATDNTKGLGDGLDMFTGQPADVSSLDRYEYHIEAQLPSKQILKQIIIEGAEGTVDDVAEVLVDLGLRIRDAYREGKLPLNWTNRRAIACAKNALLFKSVPTGIRYGFLNKLPEDNEVQLVQQIYREMGYDLEYGEL